MNGLIKSPPEQPPLSNRNAYTTWPGGVDPTVPLYNTDNQKFGGARRRRSRRASRKSRKVGGRRKNSRKVNRKNSRKNVRKNRKNTRKVYRKSRRASRRFRGGYATCSPVASGSASIPMTSSVCPEGYFQDKGLIA
jgi:hypothetical protein